MNIKELITAVRSLLDRVAKIEERLNSVTEPEKAKTDVKAKRPYKRRDPVQG